MVVPGRNCRAAAWFISWRGYSLSSAARFLFPCESPIALPVNVWQPSPHLAPQTGHSISSELNMRQVYPVGADVQRPWIVSRTTTFPSAA